MFSTGSCSRMTFAGPQKNVISTNAERSRWQSSAVTALALVNSLFGDTWIEEDAITT